MEAIKVQVNTCNSELDKCLGDEKKPWTKYLALAEEKTNVPRKYIFLGESTILYHLRVTHNPFT